MSTIAPERASASPPAPSKPSSTGTPSSAAPLKLLMLRLHFYAGVLVGPFLLVAALSGFLYAISPMIEQVVDRQQLTASSTAQNVPVATQIETAVQRHPDLAFSAVVPGDSGRTTRVLFADPSLPSKSHQRVVFVDPSDGSVRGDTVQYGSSGALPLRAWIGELHGSLHLGEPGRIYSELAASWLAPLALGGIWMWWTRRRRAASRSTASPSREGNARRGRAQLRQTHSTIGVWFSLGMFVLAATGLTWSTYAGENVSDLRKTLNWTTPSLSAKAPSSAAGEHAGHGGGASGHSSAGMPAASPAAQADAVLAIAHRAGLSSPIQLTPPKAEGTPWRAKEGRRSWTAGPDAVAIDAQSGTVVQRIDFADYPLAAKLTDWGIRAHMGFLFGLLNQLLLAAVAAAVTVLTIWGYRMWWARKPTAGFGRPPVRGSLKQLIVNRPIPTVIGLVLAAAIGWAVPLLGLSVLAFLVVDVALGAVSRFRGATK